MNAIEILKQIRQVFDDAAAPAVDPAPAPEQEPAKEDAPVEFKEYSLADGTVVMVDKLEAGGTVKIGEDVAPAGDYTLADGSTLTVGEGGAIASITAPQAAAVEPDPAPAPQVEPATQVDYTQNFAAIEAKFAELADENAKLKQAFSQLVNLVEELTKTPAAEHTEAVTKNIFEDRAASKKERYAAILQTISKIKNK
jgi:hypothetical protein